MAASAKGDRRAAPEPERLSRDVHEGDVPSHEERAVGLDLDLHVAHFFTSARLFSRSRKRVFALFRKSKAFPLPSHPTSVTFAARPGRETTSVGKPCRPYRLATASISGVFFPVSRMRSSTRIGT